MLDFMRPEFFDIFGIGVFLFITCISIFGLKTNKKIPKWALIILLIIGILGLIIDGTIVIMTYVI